MRHTQIDGLNRSSSLSLNLSPPQVLQSMPRSLMRSLTCPSKKKKKPNKQKTNAVQTAAFLQSRDVRQQPGSCLACTSLLLTRLQLASLLPTSVARAGSTRRVYDRLTQGTGVTPSAFVSTRCHRLINCSEILPTRPVSNEDDSLNRLGGARAVWHKTTPWEME